LYRSRATRTRVTIIIVPAITAPVTWRPVFFREVSMTAGIGITTEATKGISFIDVEIRRKHPVMMWPIPVKSKTGVATSARAINCIPHGSYHGRLVLIREV
jgi:hypothetical protein